ncbi:NUDIX hydrolase [Lentzea fradiae]|nr:NUDIX domain-containing protein [Lentzea fradiae]
MIDKVAWLYLKDGRVLGTRSAGNDTFYLPGGKREPGETDVETLVREIREELSVEIDASSARYAGTFEAQAHGKPPGVTLRMACYTASFEGEPVASAEIAEIAWLTSADADRVSDMARIVFAHLRERGELS